MYISSENNHDKLTWGLISCGRTDEKLGDAFFIISESSDKVVIGKFEAGNSPTISFPFSLRL